MAGTAFRRGKFVGRLEADAAWRAKDAVRKSKELSDRALDAFRKQQATDWSGLSEEELEKRLDFHGLLRTVVDEQDGGTATTRKEFTPAMSNLASRYETAPPGSNPTTDAPQQKAQTTATVRS